MMSTHHDQETSFYFLLWNPKLFSKIELDADMDKMKKDGRVEWHFGDMKKLSSEKNMVFLYRTESGIDNGIIGYGDILSKESYEAASFNKSGRANKVDVYIKYLGET